MIFHHHEAVLATGTKEDKENYLLRKGWEVEDDAVRFLNLTFSDDYTKYTILNENPGSKLFDHDCWRKHHTKHNQDNGVGVIHMVSTRYQGAVDYWI